MSSPRIYTKRLKEPEKSKIDNRKRKMATISPSSSQAGQNRPTPTLYFAYGSNLHFQQMAKRCPESRYIGHAYLFEYRWQINQRGYANVVRSNGDVVEGLVFSLSKKDEERLDRNEGVSRRLYDKEYEKIQLVQAPKLIRNFKVADIVREGGPEATLRSGTEEQLRRDDSSAIVAALVYLSTIYVTDRPPKEEYVGRMEMGLSDAGRLGMSLSYITAIRPRLRLIGGNNNDESNSTNSKKAKLKRPSTRSTVPSPAKNSKAAPKAASKVPFNLPLPAGLTHTSSPASQRLPAEVQCSRGRTSRPVQRKPVVSDSFTPPSLPKFTTTVVTQINAWQEGADSGKENRR